jgi:hypothetical protein
LRGASRPPADHISDDNGDDSCAQDYAHNAMADKRPVRTRCLVLAVGGALIYRTPASPSRARSVLALRTACPAPSLLK